MLLLKLCSFTGLAGLVLGAPSHSHVLHEQRDHIPAGWSYHSPIDKHTVLPVRVGLKQSNLDAAHDVLMEVSDPESPKYGQHWTDADIVNFFAPAVETVEAVKEWLANAGFKADRVVQSSNRGWLEFKATAIEMENLLKTKYHVYKHETGDPQVVCDQYSVPANVQKHIDFITPTVDFDSIVVNREGKGKRKREVDVVNKWSGPKRGNKGLPSADAKYTRSSICSEYITPQCLRALYGIPRNTLALSSFGVAEYYPETYLQDDLNLFQNNTLDGLNLDTNSGRIPVGTAPITVRLDGGIFSTETGFGYQGEPDLDLQYAMDLAWPQQIQLLQGAGSYNFSFNNFLDAFDASYCAGDDPYYDETFPDPSAYNHPEQCGSYKAPDVISTSYAYNEHDLSPAYEARQCNEYLKLGLKGTSFLFSSGDYGVAGNGGACIRQNGSYTGYNANTGRFNPSFPGTCPYITAVGATQIPEGASPTAPETACETVIYSGGGFSNNFALPSYQQAAVTNWFTNFKPKYGKYKIPASLAGANTRYNATGKSRGLPDVSANGANYVIFVDGQAELVYGTSASTPVFASVVSQINNARLNASKSALGFLNPSFYKNPGMFNDITSGNNQGCGTVGFSAVQGWDPVTGLGTPNYPKMLKYFMGLP